ncbi:UDP-glycosyltransferase UGT5-like [Euwallacea fornicatus]|uniref:UDP-glycosyltransferase UGT5-like n=1 Tax=Euwallacea fornicatus TaxID=995702 RepID=UPI00338E6480
MNPLQILLLMITTASAANILIVYETARRSHQIWIGELAQALSKKGHNVTVGGSFSRAIAQSDVYHPITFEGIFLTHYKVNRSEHVTANPLKKIYLNQDYNYAICNRTYRSNGFNSLWNYPKNFTFDLILVDMTFGPCLYPLIQKFGSPYTIGFTPSSLTPYLSDAFGNHVYPSNFVSSIIEPPKGENTFLNRVSNYLFTKLEIFWKNTVERRMLENLAQSLLNETFDFDHLQKAISLLFVNEYPLLNEPIGLTPNIIPVGGLHIRPLEPLPGILQSIIDNANQGIVFFSTGTDVQQNIFSQKTKRNFANAFKRLVQKTVIWKDNIDDDEHPFNNQPSNILIHKWIPQLEVLGHKHTKLIITTGGSLTIQEAIYHGVPVLGIPIYNEHQKNIQFIVDKNLGLKLDYHNLTEENIYDALNTILQNPIYLENMDQFAKKFRDQPQNPLLKALYWVEYVLRHNATEGADFLTPKTRNMSYLLAYSGDVELSLISILVLGVIIGLKIFLIILRILFTGRKPIKAIKKKKQ